MDNATRYKQGEADILAFYMGRILQSIIFFAYDIREELMSLPISQDSKDLIKDSTPMGKTMRFMPIVSDITNDIQRLNDIYILAEFRKTRSG